MGWCIGGIVVLYFASFSLYNGCVSSTYHPGRCRYFGETTEGNTVVATFLPEKRHLLLLEYNEKENNVVAAASASYTINNWKWWGWRFYTKHSASAETSRYGDGWFGLFRLRIRPYDSTPTSVSLRILNKKDDRKDGMALFGEYTNNDCFNMDIEFHNDGLKLPNGGFLHRVEASESEFNDDIEVDNMLNAKKQTRDS